MADPLPSWNDTATRAAIVEDVPRVVDFGSGPHDRQAAITVSS
jgi:hypothetical protein